MEKLFWIIFEVLLVIVEIFFCIRLQDINSTYKKLKKEYSLSTKTTANGHSGRLRADVEKDLINAKVELISWACISAACAYACVDCFMWIIG